MAISFVSMNPTPSGHERFSEAKETFDGRSVLDVSRLLKRRFRERRVVKCVMFETQEGMVEMVEDDLMGDETIYYVEFGEFEDETYEGDAEQSTASVPCCTKPKAESKPTSFAALFDCVAKNDYETLYRAILNCQHPMQCCGVEFCEKSWPQWNHPGACDYIPAPISIH